MPETQKIFCRVLIAAHESERLQNFFNAFAAECAYDGSDRERYRMYFWAGAAYNLIMSGCARGHPSRRTRWPITATRPVCRARRPDALGRSPGGAANMALRRSLSAKDHTAAQKTPPVPQHRGRPL